MSFIDSKEIEALLAEAKATSITEIVSFITDHVSRLLVQQVAEVAERVGEHQERIGELERPKGMDRIMIEEVKALVEAMMDQREDSLKKELDHKHRENICNSFEMQDHSRRSLNQMDLNNLINIQNGTQSQQMRRGSTGCSSQLYQKCQIGGPEIKQGRLNGEVRQLREDLLNRAERREVIEVKQALSLLQKEVLGKVTFDEAEKLLMRFQKEVWTRLGETRTWGEEMEGKLSKALVTETQALKMEIEELGKSKQTSSKLQKKVKKYLQEMAYVRSDLQRLEKSISANVAACKSEHQSQLESLYTQQQLVEQIADKIVHQNRHRGSGLWSAIFMCAPLAFKNGCVAWQREVINTDLGVFQWEAGKTNIKVVNAGFYQIGCAAFGGTTKKCPILSINNDSIGKFDGRGGGQLVPRWYFREWVHIRQNRSVLSVKFQGEENGSCVLLCISRMI